jgi:CRP-like cAMP-binding protein
MTAASCYLFQNLPAEKIKAIGAISRVQTLPAGQWLFHKTDRAENIYLVEEGAIELLMPVEPDIEVPVALIRPGNGCVGIGALLEPYTYTLSARSKEDSRLNAIASSDLRALFKTDPEFGRTVMSNLAQRLLDRLVETREEVKIHFMNLIQSATFS